MRCLWHRPILTATATTVLGLSFVFGRAGAEWWVGIETAARLKHPVDAVETSFLDHWRHLHRRPEVSMRSLSFQVDVPCPRPRVTAIRFQNTSTRVLNNVWFYSADMPNFYSAPTIATSATRGTRTPTEKIVALWNLFPRYHVHQYPLTSSSLCSDPPTLFAVLGGAQCNNASDALEALCQLEGIETRRLGVEYHGPRGETIAHSTLEARVGNRWIFLDPDGHAIYRRTDGAWASAQDLAANASLIAMRPHGYYDRTVYARAFSEGRVIVHERSEYPFRRAKAYTDPEKFRFFRHLMRYDLLPGASVTLYPQQRRKFCGTYGPKGPPAYCNGVLTWELRPEHLTRPDQGLALTNLHCRPGKDTFHLVPEHKFGEASIIVPVVSPYFLVGGILEGELEGDSGIEVFFQRFPLGVTPLHEEWQALGHFRRKFALRFDETLNDQPCFGFAIKLVIPRRGIAIRRLRIVADMQLSPLALPQIHQGDNSFFLYTENSNTCVQNATATADQTTVNFSDGLRLDFSFAPQRGEPERLAKSETVSPSPIALRDKCPAGSSL